MLSMRCLEIIKWRCYRGSLIFELGSGDGVEVWIVILGLWVWI